MMRKLAMMLALSLVCLLVWAQQVGSGALSRADGALSPCTGALSRADGALAQVTETPTETPTATPTVTPTPSPTMTPYGADGYEPNDTPEQATLIGAGQTLHQTLHVGDTDWLIVWLKIGRTYRISSEVLPGGDTLLRLYDEHLALLAESDDLSPGNLSSEITFVPSIEAFYYAQVTSAVTGLWGEYNFRIIEELPTPSPTMTLTPTMTSTPTNTPAPGDDHEPNDDFTTATQILMGESVQGTISENDLDHFLIYVKPGNTYRCVVTPQGFDSELVLYDQGQVEIDRNDDQAPNNPGSALSWYAHYEGWAYPRVGAAVPVPTGDEGTYTLVCVSLSPTATPTITPSSTPRPSTTPQPTPTPNDAYEPNYNFDLAAEIGVGFAAQAVIAASDNDFFKVYVKTGNVYRCDVTPQGFDSNLIVYDQGRAGIAGSDDRAPNDVGSALTWQAAYTGWAYLLVGPVSGTGPYTLLCVVVLPTPTPTRPIVTPLPALPTAAPVTIPTVTSSSQVTPGPGQAPGDAATATASPPTPTPTPEVVFNVTLVIYYDHNDNRAPEPDEGIQGASVVLIDPVSNKPLAQVFTDATGSVYLSHTGLEQGTVAIPYLGFSRDTRSGEHLVVRIQPQRLPGLLP